MIAFRRFVYHVHLTLGTGTAWKPSPTTPTTRDGVETVPYDSGCCVDVNFHGHPQPGMAWKPSPTTPTTRDGMEAVPYDPSTVTRNPGRRGNRPLRHPQPGTAWKPSPTTPATRDGVEAVPYDTRYRKVDISNHLVLMVSLGN